MSEKQEARVKPPEAYPGADFDSPDLNQHQWDELCAHVGVSLSRDAREKIDFDLWWCKWQKLNATCIPRPAEMRRRFRQFVKGADMCLNAFGYLQLAGIKSAADHPPVSANINIVGTAGGAWQSLHDAAKSDRWDSGYYTKRALKGLVDEDDFFIALHALSYTAARAITDWATDKGGRPSSGDRQFIQKLLRVLRSEGVAIAYPHDRTLPDSARMSGPGWDVLVELWILRPDVFASNEKSTLGKYYRAAHAKIAGTNP